MTVDRLPESARGGSKSDGDDAGLSTATILSMCDRLLGEVGRRSHMFSWLRAPGSGDRPEAPPSGAAGHRHWLAVDAYYPRSRLVVMCRPIPRPHEALYRELIPAHGLGLLSLDPAALGPDPAAVESALAAKFFDLEHVPRGQPAPQAAGPSRREARREPASDPGRSWTPVTVQRTPVGPAVQQGLGLVVGLALATVLIAEVYLAAVAVAFDASRPVLGFAIALDACARGLGTLAAERAGERGWALLCAIGGSPIVAWFALRARAQGAEAEPAPLAGLLALLAGALALVGLLIGS